MAKGFSDKEKEIIVEKLKNTGIELFGNLGIKKTGIEDLTKAAGIARGSFYLFYESKEVFFLELLDEAEQRIKTELIDVINNSTGSPREILKNFLKEYIYSVLEKNPILKILINHSDEFEALLRKVPEENLKKHTQNDERSILEFIRNFNEKGIFIKEKPETLSALFRSIIFMALHKSTIGDILFPAVIELITDGLSYSLIETK